MAKSELHELLLNYIRVRSALIGAERRVSALSQDVEAGKESVWTLRDDKVEETGECADEKEVTAVLQFKVIQMLARLNEMVFFLLHFQALIHFRWLNTTKQQPRSSPTRSRI